VQAQRAYRPSASGTSVSLVGGRLIAKALPWAVGLSSGAGFVLLCLKTNAGHVYTTAAAILFVFVAADLVFVLRTG
jgi:hypothetical protein